jgi:hypothetical protein
MIEILNPDLTPLADAEVPALEAGQDSGVVPFAIRNGAGGDDASELLLVVQAVDPASGEWVSSGVPPLDELWARVRLTGQDATAAPAQQLELADWTAIGATRGLRIATLLAGGIRTGELLMRPPATAPDLAWRWRLAIVADEHSHAVPPGARAGILTGLGDAGHSAALRGLAVTASDTPDDAVHVAAGHCVCRGRLYGQVAATLPLDQADAAAEALEAGQAYLAIVSAGAAGLTITKGARGAVPVRPAPPVWDIPLAVVEVRYQAGGTTIVEATDLTDLLVYDRYLVQPGAGLELRLHAGQAIGGGTLRHHGTRQALPLPASATRFLWQRANGAPELTAGDPPETTALGPWWRVTTDGAGVTDLVDLRAYAADTVVLHLRGDLPGAPGEIATQLVAHDGLVLEQILYRLSDNGGGTAGQTQLDLEIDGVTAYTSFATDDQRPAWAFDAAELQVADRIHEVTEMRAGGMVRLVSIEHPAGGAPVWAEAYLVCRRG